MLDHIVIIPLGLYRVNKATDPHTSIKETGVTESIKPQIRIPPLKKRGSTLMKNSQEPTPSRLELIRAPPKAKHTGKKILRNRANQSPPLITRLDPSLPILIYCPLSITADSVEPSFRSFRILCCLLCSGLVCAWFLLIGILH